MSCVEDYDEEFANQFFEAFDFYYKTCNKTKVIKISDYVLEPLGGQFFDGFSIGKD